MEDTQPCIKKQDFFGFWKIGHPSVPRPPLQSDNILAHAPGPDIAPKLPAVPQVGMPPSAMHAGMLGKPSQDPQNPVLFLPSLYPSSSSSSPPDPLNKPEHLRTSSLWIPYLS